MHIDTTKPPYKVGLDATRPYENDRRAGRTHPDRVEVIEVTDRRHAMNRGQVRASTKPTRAERRARGQRGSYSPRPRVGKAELRFARALPFAVNLYTWDESKVERLNADGQVVGRRRLVDEKVGSVTVFGIRFTRQQIEQAQA